MIEDDVVRGIEVLHIDRPESGKTRKAPVRRTWVRRARAARTPSFRTGYSKRSRYGWVCRVVTLRALSR